MVQVKSERMRAAIYARVSTEEQSDNGYSIEEQQVLGIEHCKRKEFEIVGVYADKGVSAKNMNRLEIQRLISDIKLGKIDVVVAWKISRISRNLKELLEFIDIIDKYNVSIIFISEAIDLTQPSGVLMLQMMGSVAEFERQCISENVYMGMRARAKDGYTNGGNGLLGYNLKKEYEGKSSFGKKKSLSTLVINEEEAAVVRKIYELYTSGKGYKAIANELNTTGYRTKRGNLFNVAGIKGILTNPTYMGKVRFGHYRNWDKKRRRGLNPDEIIVEGRHEAIISEEQFDLVQKIMEIRGGQRAKKHSDMNILSGILRCPECGYGMVLSRAPLGNGKKRAYYSCGAWKSKGIAACHANSIRLDDANEEVLDRVSQLVSNEKISRKIISKMNRDSKNKFKPLMCEIENVDSRLMKLSNSKRKIFEMLEEDVLSTQEFLERKEELNREEEKLQERKKELEEKIRYLGIGEVNYEEVKNVLKEIKTYLKSTETEQLRVLLHLMIDSIVITNTKPRQIQEINIKLNKSLVEFLQNEDTSKDVSFYCAPCLKEDVYLQI